MPQKKTGQKIAIEILKGIVRQLGTPTPKTRRPQTVQPPIQGSPGCGGCSRGR